MFIIEIIHAYCREFGNIEGAKKIKRIHIVPPKPNISVWCISFQSFLCVCVCVFLKGERQYNHC